MSLRIHLYGNNVKNTNINNTWFVCSCQRVKNNNEKLRII